MNSRISELLQEIHLLEEELEDALRTHEATFLYRLEGRKVQFEEAVSRAHEKLRINSFRWLRDSKPRNLMSAPVIYSLILPLLLFDIWISLYQALCFPLYGIDRVNRKKYIVLDRYQLSYLNSIERFHCVYCGYANGLIAYAREIAARTEQYWCPVKHAGKVLDPHRRYARFADFGDSMAFQQHVEQMRAALAEHG